MPPPPPPWKLQVFMHVINQLISSIILMKNSNKHTIIILEYISDCIFKKYQDQSRKGASPGPYDACSVRACENACLQANPCTGFDFDTKYDLCWIHHIPLSPSLTIPDVKVHQFIKESHCKSKFKF